jgi:transcriptional regulator with XRE-family HTH domain
MYEQRIISILELIKHRRSKLGYSQQYMAGKLGISQNMYSKFELNYSKITIGRFIAICEVLEIDLHQILKTK